MVEPRTLPQSGTRATWTAPGLTDSRSVWSASRLAGALDAPPCPTAGASSAHSKGFATIRARGQFAPVPRRRTWLDKRLGGEIRLADFTQ